MDALDLAMEWARETSVGTTPEPGARSKGSVVGGKPWNTHGGRTSRRLADYGESEQGLRRPGTRRRWWPQASAMGCSGKLLSIGDDYRMEDETGRRDCKVNGKAVRVRATLILKDSFGQRETRRSRNAS